MPKISISVPVYNVEKYLRQCLDSLVNQTLKDIEIVVVNDGSTDSSEAICQEYVKKDPRVVLINKENGGLASARQAAFDVATGEFFCACDADDWAEPDMYERLYKKAVETDADIVMCDYWSEYPNGSCVTNVCYIDSSCSDLLDNALNGILACQVWNKMFRRKLFINNQIEWEKGINLGEDFLIMLKILQHPTNFVHLNIPLYHYRRDMNSTSYTNNVTMETFKQSLFIRHWIRQHIDSQKYVNGIFRLWINLAFTGLRVNDGMDKKYYRDEVLNNISISDFFRYSYPKVKGILILFTKLFGYDLGKWLFKIGYKSVYK